MSPLYGHTIVFIHESVGSDAIAEEYVEGREMTVSVLGNGRLTTLTPWELTFKSLPEGSLPIATARAKFDLEYQKRVGLTTSAAKDLSPPLTKRLVAGSKHRLKIPPLWFPTILDTYLR